MGIVLRKPGTAPVRVIPPVLQPSVDDGYKSPFKESYHQEEAPRASPTVDAPAPVANPATAKPKAIIKIGGGKPVKPGLPPSSAKPADAVQLAAAGLTDKAQEPTSRDLYPPVMPGEHVRITNTLFPWVKHYRPGDIARVMYSSPTHSHPEDPWKYRAYFLEIVSDGPTKGSKAMLFRWEFEPRHDATPPPKIDGRVITQT